MKALIRSGSPAITENMNVPWINWNTGMPLTCQDWYGGPYQLVDDYIEMADGAIHDVAVYPEPEDPAADTIVIDGVTYTRTS